MTYKLFIDDERLPMDDGWITVRTSADAIEAVKRFDMPMFISFDHDLGGDDTSMKFIKWMIDEFFDNHLKIPVGFDYYVHSQNPVGKANIEGLMNSFLRQLNSVHFGV